ncbi:MAG TPA: TonB-dependent receptor plug domain-containing protein, partial [Azonexus sp.]|nr:TonB-dependent receptor plug domain-containing protein [Azonexus sp.]
MALSLSALSFQTASPAADLAGMSFDELADIRITSVSKRDESLADAAASVFVITNDDIRRSGATSLPEALRLAPNLHVAQVNANNYVISARGFSGTSANKMLVLIDGRSVYTPLFSGVFWDVQNVMLEDVDRIEVIRGPGGTLWGTNAVNGVINVITRSAANTQGGLATVGAGNRESITALRYGGRMGADGSYRVYGKYGERKHTETARGSAIDDASNLAQAGFRIDWGRAGDQLMMQGNVYDGSERQPATGTTVAVGAIQVSGVNLLTRWERALEREGKLSLQFYYDSTKRD